MAVSVGSGCGDSGVYFSEEPIETQVLDGGIGKASAIKMAQVERDIARAAPKAWRFAPEMEEIAPTLRRAGIPEGFHLAAAEIYRRLADLKGSEEPSLENVLARLISHRFTR